MLDKETKRSRRTNSQTKTHADIYIIMKPGPVPVEKKRREEGCRGRQDRQTSRKALAHMLNSSSGDRRDIDNRADIYLSCSRGGDGSFAARQTGKEEATGSRITIQGDFVFAGVSRLLQS